MESIFLNDFFVNIDVAVYKFFESLSCTFMDVFMTLTTYLGDKGVFWICLTLCLLIPKKTRKLGLYMGFGLAVATLVNNLGLKELFNRPRPFNLDPKVWAEHGYEYIYPGLVPHPDSLSFPSGHASTSLGAALPFLIKGNKKAGIPVFIVAILIGLSRIYVHVHYPTDVFFGMIVGIICGLLAVLIVDKLVLGIIVPKLEKKFNKKIV